MSFARILTLHVAMQMGPSHDPVSWTFGVWPLRILIKSCLDVFRFIATVHDELAQMLSMVVLTLIDVDPTHAKEAHELLQCGPATDTLRHDKPMRDLVPGPVASAILPTWLPNESDGEASLSVYKASDPAKLNQSFLLIFCTRHIVTVPPTWDGTRSAGFSDFPAYSQMLTA